MMILFLYIIFEGHGYVRSVESESSSETTSISNIATSPSVCFNRNKPTEFATHHSFPTVSGLSCKSYSKCASNDADPNNPWCYVESGYQPWDYCKVPICPTNATNQLSPTITQIRLACITTNDPTGTRYNGVLNRTKSHIQCQPWNDSVPHSPIIKPLDSTFVNHNFCRNPDGDLGGPWCYTSESTLRWEHCHVPTCEQQFTELREARVLEKEVGKVDFFRDGDVSMICQWPWVVSVRVRISSSTMMHRCSGVLLARNIVLTSSSCLRLDVDPGNVHIYAGSHISNDQNYSPFLQNQGLVSIHRHHKYNLAILRLETPLLYTGCVRSIKLATMKNRKQKVWAIGWHESRPFSKLRQRFLKIKNCEKTGYCSRSKSKGEKCASQYSDFIFKRYGHHPNKHSFAVVGVRNHIKLKPSVNR